MSEAGLSYMGFTVYSSMQCSNLVSGSENTNQNVGTTITAPSETINTPTKLTSGRSALNMEEDNFEGSANQPIRNGVVK
jgi:hypothetical protein